MLLWALVGDKVWWGDQGSLDAHSSSSSDANAATLNSTDFVFVTRFSP